jgi:hypothetical protein
MWPLKWDCERKHEAVELSDDGLTASANAPGYRTVFASTPLPAHGTDSFSFQVGPRGNGMIGVATCNASTRAYLGWDGSGYGLAWHGKFFHNGSPLHKQKFEDVSFSPQDIVTVTTDTSSGSFRVANRTTGKAKTLATPYLAGKTVYPAASLYTAVFTLVPTPVVQTLPCSECFLAS